MELDFAFLARSADVSPDGTLSMLGAGFETVRSKVFPRAIPLVIVMRLTGVEPIKKEVFVELDVIGPDGTTILEAPIGQPMSPFQLARTDSVAPSLTASFIIGFGALLLPKAGPYQIQLRLTESASVIEKTFRLNAEAVDA